MLPCLGCHWPKRIELGDFHHAPKFKDKVRAHLHLVMAHTSQQGAYTLEIALLLVGALRRQVYIEIKKFLNSLFCHSVLVEQTS